MRKIMVLIVVLVMATSGCASFWETSSNVAQNVGIVAQKVCNFDVNMSVEAQNAMQFLSVASTIVGSVFLGTKFTAAQALDVFNTVANASTTGACVLLTDLEAAMEYFNTMSVKYKVVMAAKGTKATVQVPSLLNLNAKLSAERQLGK